MTLLTAGGFEAPPVECHACPDLLAKAMVYVSGPPQRVQDMAAKVRLLGVRTASLKLDDSRGH